MQAIGLIETYGLIAAIESADVMLKSAQVELVEKSLAGAGLVTIVVTGDVGAVKSAVDAAAAAVSRLSESALISQHVIPRPHDETEVLFAKKRVEKPESQEPKVKNKVTLGEEGEDSKKSPLPKGK